LTPAVSLYFTKKKTTDPGTPMAKDDGQAKVRADTKENILFITLSGNIRKKHVESIYTDIRFGVADLKPGFTVITDLLQAKIAHLSGVASFKKITSYLLSNGVGKIVRIIGENSLILKQILRISAAIQGYTPIYVSSLEEAKAKISEQ
jgi:hypothetical protein